MVVEIRLYKRWDLDLIALKGAGYNMSQVFKHVISSYANMSPIHLYVDELINFEVDDIKSIHFRVSIPNADTNSCYMLKHIKKRYRNAFCKMLVRNALVQQNLNIFFDDARLDEFHEADLRDKYTNYRDLYRLSDFKDTNRNFNVGSKTIKLSTPEFTKRTTTRPSFSVSQVEKPKVITKPAVAIPRQTVESVEEVKKPIETESQNQPMKDLNVKSEEPAANAETSDNIMAMFDAL